MSACLFKLNEDGDLPLTTMLITSSQNYKADKKNLYVSFKLLLLYSFRYRVFIFICCIMSKIKCFICMFSLIFIVNTFKTIHQNVILYN